MSSHDLRKDLAEILRRVQAGEDITITVKGRAVATLTAVPPVRRRWLSGLEFAERMRRAQADPGYAMTLPP